eukprot:822780-Pyramimonas_sp.AAC.1
MRNADPKPKPRKSRVGADQNHPRAPARPLPLRTLLTRRIAAVAIESASGPLPAPVLDDRAARA